jgi:hypothetical protein
MIILRGPDTHVYVTEWNGKTVWKAGVNTPWSVVGTYSKDVGDIILVVDDVVELREDIRGMYVITQSHRVALEAVHRGAYCIKCSFFEGLWRLRNILN